MTKMTRTAMERSLGLERVAGSDGRSTHGNLLRHVYSGVLIRGDRHVNGRRGYRATLPNGEVVHDTLGRVVARCEAVRS